MKCQPLRDPFIILSLGFESPLSDGIWSHNYLFVSSDIFVYLTKKEERNVLVLVRIFRKTARMKEAALFNGIFLISC